jgi:hypothetical protein
MKSLFGRLFVLLSSLLPLLFSRLFVAPLDRSLPCSSLASSKGKIHMSEGKAAQR